MSTDNVFKLSLSLEQLSTIAVAVTIWNLPVVKEEVHKYLVEYDTRNKHPSEDWDRVIEHAIHQMNFCFPEKLLWNIKTLVQILGYKVYNWILHVINVLKHNLKYAEKIYWTCNGEIDEMEIVKYWFTNLMELGPIHHKCFLKNPLFCLASSYVQEDFILLHLEEMKNEIFRHLLASQKRLDWNEYAVIATWRFFCENKKKNIALNCFRNSDNLPNLPANELFFMSVKSGLKFAVQYFFYKLKDDIKPREIKKGLEECLNTSKYSYKIGNSVEIMIFLIKQMDDVKKLEFITKHFEFLFMRLLYTWPNQELCLNLLINGPNYLPDVHDKLLKKMMDDLTKEDCYKAKYFGKGVIYNQIFQSLLEKMPKEVKKEIFLENNYKYLNSLKFFNSDILNLIINDPDLSDCRKNMIQIVETHFQNLILKGGRYEVVDKLMKLCSSGEEKPDKQKYNFLTTFLTAGEMDLAEEHLNWLYDSDSERSAAKKQIDVATICTTLIKKNRLDLARKYLKWQCSNVEIQKNIKTGMVLNGVLRDQVYQMWCNQKDFGLLPAAVVEVQCEQLLFWFLESNENAIKFRETKLIENNESFIEKYWNHVFYHPSFVYFDTFLKFCFWSEEKIIHLREKIKANTEWWIDTYAVEKNNILMVDALFEWAFKDNHEERKNVISKYMESPKGALLILKAFKTVNGISGILLLLNSWMASNNDPVYLEKIKINLDACEDGLITDSTISSIKSLLDDVKRGAKLSIGQVNAKTRNFLR